MKRLTYIIAFCLISGLASAQDYEAILSQIESNNASLKALRQEVEADKLDARTGLTPDDPELELGYLWETKDPEGGYRIDIGVSQSFDFPTAYIWRKRISDGECSAAELRYEIGRKTILREAEQICINLSYCNALAAELEKCLLNAETIEEVYSDKYERGSAGLLELNEARFKLLASRKALSSNEVERKALLSELCRLNGGEEIPFEICGFEEEMMPGLFEDWFDYAVNGNTELRSLEIERELAENERKLAVAEWLPKFTIGYTSERVANSTLEGIGGGISIPLWANKGKVRAAKARQAALEAKAQDEYLKFRASLRQTWDKAEQLQILAYDYKRTLGELNNSQLLLEALNAGEIDLETYVVGTELWLDEVQEVLATERDYKLLLAELRYFTR